MDWPSLSVIIPSFNQGAFIERTLLSVLHQDYPGAVQVVVADGGSTDGTAAVLERYPQVQWWSRKDRGFADAVNQGLAAATGEVVAIQSSDDYYLQGAFRKAIPVLQQQGPQIAFVSGAEIICQGEGYHCDMKPKHYVSLLNPGALIAPYHFYAPQHCTFVRRSAIDRVGGLRKSVDQCADFDLWYRILHFYKGLLLPEYLAVYQLHPEQRGQAKADLWIKSHEFVVESCEREEQYSRHFRPTLSQKKETLRFLQMNWYWLAGGSEHQRKRRALALDVLQHKDQWSQQMQIRARFHSKATSVFGKAIQGLKANKAMRRLLGREPLETAGRKRLQAHGIDLDWWRAGQVKVNR